MSTDFLKELANAAHQTCGLLEGPQHRGDVAQGADVLASVIDYLEREPDEPLSGDDRKGFSFASRLIIREMIGDSAFENPSPRPFLL